MKSMSDHGNVWTFWHAHFMNTYNTFFEEQTYFQLMEELHLHLLKLSQNLRSIKLTGLKMSYSLSSSYLKTLLN